MGPPVSPNGNRRRSQEVPGFYVGVRGCCITFESDCNSIGRCLHFCWKGLYCYRDVSTFPLKGDELKLESVCIFILGNPISVGRFLHFPWERAVLPLGGVYISRFWRVGMSGISYWQDKTYTKSAGTSSIPETMYIIWHLRGEQEEDREPIVPRLNPQYMPQRD